VPADPGAAPVDNTIVTEIISTTCPTWRRNYKAICKALQAAGRGGAAVNIIKAMEPRLDGSTATKPQHITSTSTSQDGYRFRRRPEPTRPPKLRVNSLKRSLSRDGASPTMWRSIHDKMRSAAW
jgi:hypothetical protein